MISFSQEVCQVYIECCLSLAFDFPQSTFKNKTSKSSLSCVQAILYLASRKHTVICFCHIIPLGDKNKCRWSTKENALKICTSACIKGYWIVFVSCNKMVPVYNINKKGLLKWSSKSEKGKVWQILYSQGIVNGYYQLDFTFLIFSSFWLNMALNQQMDS